MWSEKFSLSSITTPRFLAVFEGVMVDEPNWKVKLWWNYGFAETTSSSVLARLSWRWWSFTQLEMSVTFSYLADAFIQSDLQLGNTWSDSSWRGKQTEEVLVSLRHCSNKYKLAREGINKDNVFQVLLKEMSCQLLLEGWPGSSILDRGRKVIPPARSGELSC